MSRRSLMHLSPKALLQRLTELLACDRSLTVEILHALAEVDRRRLWAEAGYSSLYAYCVGELRFSEDAAFKRMRAARLARRFPAILDRVADGRLHLSALVLLHPHLTSRNAWQLLAAAEHKTKREIRAMLAERFPQPDVPTRITPIAPSNGVRRLAPGPVGDQAPDHAACGEPVGVKPFVPRGPAVELAPGPVGSPAHGAGSEDPGLSGEASAQPAETGAELAPGPVGALLSAPASDAVPPPVCPRVAPLAPERYAIQFTMSQTMHEKLQHARALLGHSMPGADIPAVLEVALDALIAKLEARKFAATDAPRRQNTKPTRSRHVPAAVKREVRKRDAGQCTFVAANGRRCDARSQLEYDHVIPIARGGRSTAENLRLLCRAHNQLEAERALGEGFMHELRERARAAIVRAARPPGPVAPPPG